MSHTPLGPSGYDWYSRCTAAPAAVSHKVRASTSFSVEGTVAHALLAKSISQYVLPTHQDMTPREFIGTDIYIEEDDVKGYFEVTPEMGEEVEKAYDYVLDNLPRKAQVWVEQKMDLSKTMPDQKGTGDIIAISPDWSELHVFDLKYGRGVLVLVDDNNQLKLYGLGAIDNYIPLEHREKLKKVVLHIMQPRKNYCDRWETTRGKLEHFRVEARGVYDIVTSGKGEFNPGEKQCKFCPNRSTCRYLAKSHIKLVYGEDELRERPVYRDVSEMTPTEQRALWPHLDFIAAWANNAKVYMDDQARTGAAVYPGLKLVEGKKGKRDWVDDQMALNYVRFLAFEEGLEIADDDLYSRKFKSPNQVENVIGRKNIKDKKEFASLYSQGEGQPTLVDESDPRQPIEASLKSEFDDVLEVSTDVDDLGLEL